VNIGGLPAAGIAVLDGLDAKAQTAHNTRTHQNYFSGPCPPPTNAQAPKSGPAATDVLKSIASHVNVDVGVSGGGGEDRHRHHADDRRRADEKLTRDEKRLHGDQARKEEKLRTEEKHRDHGEKPWTDNRVKIAVNPDIEHDREIIDQHRKRKEMWEKKLHGKPAPGPEEKKHLERDIKTEEDIIRRYEEDLKRRGGRWIVLSERDVKSGGAAALYLATR
jgi:hypothetical protein